MLRKKLLRGKKEDNLSSFLFFIFYFLQIFVNISALTYSNWLGGTIFKLFFFIFFMSEISEIYFESYGCTANRNSTEILKGLVKQAGLNIAANINFADIIVINSCIVKEPTEEKIRRRIQDLLKQNKKVIVTGCISEFNKKSLYNPNLFLLTSIKDITKLILDIKNQTYNKKKYLSKRSEIKTNLPKISEEKFIGINQISEGCFGECAYCITRLAKGKLFSYPKDKIINSIKKDIASGCKEIWMTSQDNASYGQDENKYALPSLLQDVLNLKGNFFIRLGMMNPNNVLKILQELIEVYKDKKMFKFLHIPIQSGSNKILKAMNRKYTKQDILKIVKEFKKQIPKITISTDIIVGYPGENEKDFQETLDLIKEIKPEILNRSKFWPRPETPAAKFQKIDKSIMKKRMAKLSRLHLQICNENQKKWKDWRGKILVDRKGFGNTYLARSPEYKLFAIQSSKNILGKKVKVKVKKSMPHYLISEIVNNEK